MIDFPIMTMAAAAPDVAEAKPAGGAAIGEVVLATGGAMAMTVALVVVGYLHRSGRSDLLRRVAERFARVDGAPIWAALPGAVALLSLLAALFGMYWDISLHIDEGRDAGPLANPAHYFILAGLFGIFAAGYLSLVLAEGRVSRIALRIAGDWYAPLGAVVMLSTSAFALVAFPLDDAWHRLFGQDVTLWGPTHLMMIGGAGLTLLGNLVLLVESKGLRADAPPPLDRHRTTARGLVGVLTGAAAAVAAFLVRTRHLAAFGGLLIGLSTFQGEFDFGVPQFRLLFQPVLIAAAAAIALVGARLYAGRGGALGAAAYFLAIRGLVSVLVGPIAGETMPHFPLYLGEAVLVELAALLVGTGRPVRFGALAGALVGSVGVLAEWAFSQIWMPIPWPASLLADVALVAPLVGIAGGLIGAFLGAALTAPLRRSARSVPSPAVAALGLLAIVGVVVWGLQTEPPAGRAHVKLDEAGGAERHVMATVRLQPSDAAAGADWLTATAWQGGGLVVDQLREVRPGTYRSTRPIPVHGEWKAVVRLHDGSAQGGIPVYMPEDRSIPAEGVAAERRFTRPFVTDHELLQRESRSEVPGGVATLAYGAVLAIATGLIALLGWALARVGAAAGGPRSGRGAEGRRGATLPAPQGGRA